MRSNRRSFLILAVLTVAVALAATGQVIAQAPASKKFAGNKPGDEWDGNSLKMRFCWCPVGKFVMGSPKYEAKRKDDEQQVFVTLSRGFWMGKYEVTQDEWQRVMGTNPSEFKGKTLPVEQVSWDDAAKFCEKLTKLERDLAKLPDGWEYRLPTEAQWEYACRGGTSSTVYSFGDDPKELDDFAWYRRNSEDKTHAVGQKKSNRWGLRDMHGNVFESCRDWYHAKLPGGTDPEATSKATGRVYRGGSWDDAAGFCRAAYRYGGGRGFRYFDLGFRLAAVQVSQ